MYSLYAMVDVSGFTISILMGLLAAALKVEISFLPRDIFEELYASVHPRGTRANHRGFLVSKRVRGLRIRSCTLTVGDVNCFRT